MKNKDLKINFRYLIGNIACLTVDSISGKIVHNDINNEEAIIIFNSLVGEKENCRTVKTLLEENEELKKQVEELSKNYNLDIPGIYIVSRNDEIIRLDKKALQYLRSLEQKNYKLENQQKEFIRYLEDEIKELQKIKETELDYDILKDVITQLLDYKEILQKYKETIGVSNDY